MTALSTSGIGLEVRERLKAKAPRKAKAKARESRRQISWAYHRRHRMGSISAMAITTSQCAAARKDAASPTYAGHASEITLPMLANQEARPKHRALGEDQSD